MTAIGRLATAFLACIAIAAGLVVSPAHSDAARVAVGAYVPGGAARERSIERFARQVGRDPLVVVSYKDWDRPPFDPAELWTVWERGAVPLVTWEPWSWDHPRRRFPLRRIAAGAFDGYVRAAARQAAAWRWPIMLRFAHEMNARWYPWGRGVRGNTAAHYRSAWRHLVAVFRQEGARNVRWVWTPYVNRGRMPFTQLYPGDRWVDWVGLDGFNWGGPTFFSFAELFGASYRTLVDITPRPVMIAETGSVEQGGSKPEWITRALTRALPRFGHVRAVLWWNEVHPSGADWRIDTSDAALAALRNGLASSNFELSREAFLAIPRRLSGP